jgi:phospholipid/cholesterol/gamma-HCH transport system substrate-binding protein
MHERRLRFQIGVFTVIAVVLLGALVLMFGSIPGLFRQSNIYYIRFTDAPGIGQNAPIRRSGVRVGEVIDVVLEGSGTVRVTAAIDKNYVVRHNDRPTLVTSLLGNDARIDIIPDPEDKDTSPLPPGAELIGLNTTSVNALVNRAADVVPTTQETLKEIRESMQRIQKSVERLTPVSEDTLKEYRALAQDVRREIPGLRRTNEDLDKLIRSANESWPRLEKSLTTTADEVASTARTYNKLGENLRVLVEGNQAKIDRIIDNLNLSLSRIASVLTEKNVENVNRILNNTAEASDQLPPLTRNANELMRDARQSLRRLDEVLNNLQQSTKPLAESSPRILRNLDESLDRLNKTMTDLRGLIQAVGASNGSLYRMLQDPTLYNRIDEAACQVNKMLPRMDRILQDLETFADKLARHPESIGLGGAIRPGNGLKDPPATGYTPHP